MTSSTQEVKYTIKCPDLHSEADWTLEVEESILKHSFVFKNIISDTKIENYEIPFPSFQLPTSKQNLEKIFDYVRKYKDYIGEENQLYKYCVSIIENDDDNYFLENFGDILQVSQFLQIDCLTKVLEDYLTKTINEMSGVPEICDMFGWKETKIHPDLEWTCHSNDW